MRNKKREYPRGWPQLCKEVEKAMVDHDISGPTELGGVLGFSRGYLSGILNGRTQPSAETWDRICSFLGVRVSTLDV